MEEKVKIITLHMSLRGKRRAQSVLHYVRFTADQERAILLLDEALSANLDYDEVDYTGQGVTELCESATTWAAYFPNSERLSAEELNSNHKFYFDASGDIESIAEQEICLGESVLFFYDETNDRTEVYGAVEEKGYSSWF